MRKSNDDIPEDEMLLAEAIAAARSRDIAWASGADFIYADGTRTISRLTNPVGCCARGALRIARPRANFYQEKFRLVPAGNDNPLAAGWSVGTDDNGESLGWAFRCAMTQDEP